MGSLFESQTQTTQNPFETNPWAPQQEYLTKGFAAGGAALDDALAINAGVTDWTADMTAQQKGLLDSTVRAGQAVQPGANDLQRTGFAMAENGTNYARNSNTMFNEAGNIDQTGLNTYNKNANSMYAQAGVNPTDQIVSDASKYAENPYMQGQIDAALYDVNKTLATDIGGINAAASGSGNINSTRAGTMEAQAMADASAQAAAISSGMRGDAYSQGLAMSQQTNQNMMDNQFRANEAVGAGYDRTLATQGQGFNQGLAANEQVGNSAAMGTDMATAGYQLGAAGRAESQAAADRYQTQSQNEINGEIARAGSELALVDQYMKAIGGSYGSQGYTSTTTQSASPFQQIAGGVTAGIGAASLW